MNSMIDGDNGLDYRSPYYLGKADEVRGPIVYGSDDSEPCKGNHEEDEQRCFECLEVLLANRK